MVNSKSLNIQKKSISYLSTLSKKMFVQYGVPANRRLGIKIDFISNESNLFVLKLPFRRKNLNVAGTVHGSAIMALAETVHGVAVFWRFPPKNTVMFTKSTELKFVSPGRGDLFVKFQLDKEMISNLEFNYSTSNKSEIEMMSIVEDVNGEVVAILKNIYHLSFRA